MSLPADLQRILTVGAKVYDTQGKRQGKVYSVNDLEVMIDYGKGQSQAYEMGDFSKLLLEDSIVANSRITIGNGDKLVIKPRVTETYESTPPVRMSGKTPNIQSTPRPETKLEIAYINEKTGRFSTEPKKGYVKIEYRKAVEKITVEVDSEMLEKLKELGLV